MANRTSTNLIGHTSKLVAAFVRGNALPIDDIAGLVHLIHASLAEVQNPPQPAADQHPAVPVKKSVLADAIVCLECGRRQKMLKRHLRTSHGLSVEDYKAKWHLPADYPMTAPAYADLRSELAKAGGLGKKRRMADTIGGPAPEQKFQAKYPPSRWSKPNS